MAATPANVLGVLSLIFWALVLVISVKYVSYVMRADNQGEGGILALMALIPSTYRGPQSRGVLLALGLFGSALLYGDGVITPAVSVLGAVEGLSLATPALTPFVVPLSVVILAGLFLVQKRGTAAVGAMFGPGHGGLVRDHRLPSAGKSMLDGAARAAARSTPNTRCSSSCGTATTASSCSARCSWR